MEKQFSPFVMGLQKRRVRSSSFKTKNEWISLRKTSQVKLAVFLLWKFCCFEIFILIFIVRTHLISISYLMIGFVMHHVTSTLKTEFSKHVVVLRYFRQINRILSRFGFKVVISPTNEVFFYDVFASLIILSQHKGFCILWQLW